MAPTVQDVQFYLNIIAVLSHHSYSNKFGQLTMVSTYQ